MGPEAVADADNSPPLVKNEIEAEAPSSYAVHGMIAQPPAHQRTPLPLPDVFARYLQHRFCHCDTQLLAVEENTVQVCRRTARGCKMWVV